MSLELLSAKEIEDQLKSLELAWTAISTDHLERVYTTDDFISGLKFVQKVAKLAEDLGHHPDISLSWGRVIVSIKTHKLGGLTSADFKLAKEIDKLG